MHHQHFYNLIWKFDCSIPSNSSSMLNYFMSDCRSSSSMPIELICTGSSTWTESCASRMQSLGRPSGKDSSTGFTWFYEFFYYFISLISEICGGYLALLWALPTFSRRRYFNILAFSKNESFIFNAFLRPRKINPANTKDKITSAAHIRSWVSSILLGFLY